MISTNVFSEWTQIGVSENETVYIHFWDISKEGNKVKVWSLFDNKTDQKGGNYLFSVYREEIDFENHTKRILDFYSKDISGGEIVLQNQILKMNKNQ